MSEKIAMEYYVHPQETWDEKKCRKVSRRRGRDGYGTLHPYRGKISDHGSVYPGYGQTTRWNGGCVRDGKWYAGETVPFPNIHEDYVIVNYPAWGYYLVRKDSEEARDHRVIHPPQHATT